MSETLSADVVALLRDAEGSAADARTAGVIADAARRMDEPLRLAIAGKVKAGKSTLLNSLVGEELAPTDAGECTRVVTWYRWSEQPRVVVYPIGSPPRTRPFSRDNGALQVDLGELTSDAVDHMDVWWPSRRLRTLTLVDTPGLASLSTDLSESTLRALGSEGDQPSEADAVVYLLRHAHSSDIRFLESFHGDDITQGTPMNTVGVLSRADEIGSARTDALEVAARVAGRYSAEPSLRQLCPIVVPVAGLLAQAGVTLREREYRWLVAIAGLSDEESVELLLTADRFATRPSSLALEESERRDLLSRLGLFGVRLGVSLIRSGSAPDSSALATEMTTRSGIAELQRVLELQFTARSQILKASTGVSVLRQVLEAGGCHGSQTLLARLEEIEASAHEFVEVRMLNALRSGELDLPDALYDDLERLWGGRGHDQASRLGLPLDTAAPEISAAALSALANWQRRAELPLSGRAERTAARAATRTLEGVLAHVSSTGA